MEVFLISEVRYREAGQILTVIKVTKLLESSCNTTPFVFEALGHEPGVWEIAGARTIRFPRRAPASPEGIPLP